MYNVLFVGYGIIGKFELNRIKCKNIHCDIYDKYSTEYNTVQNINYDFAFICVPTETNNNKCDISIVEETVKNINAEVIVIKSTIIPGTCDYLVNKYKNKHIVFAPEFSGATQHCTNFDYNFTILGGKKTDCHKVQQLLQEVFSADHKFKIVDFKTAELSKYMLNSFLATKVNFCNAFWEISNSLGIDYDDLRECFILDPRINESHTFVYDNAPYWDSHCFNKDLPAIATETNNKFLENIIDYNNYLKNKYNKNENRYKRDN